MRFSRALLASGLGACVGTGMAHAYVIGSHDDFDWFNECGEPAEGSKSTRVILAQAA